MGILLGVIAAVLFGAADNFAAFAGRTVKSSAVTRTALLVGVLLGPLFLLVQPVTWTASDVRIAALSGALNSIGLVALTIGYVKASFGIVAPVASVLTAGLPVLIDAFRGTELSDRAMIGGALGIVAVGLCSYQPSERSKVISGLAYGIFAGTLFGLAFTLLDLTNDSFGLAPIPVQRLAGLATLTVLMRVDPAPWIITKAPQRRLAITSGLISVIAMGCLQAGFRNGDAGPVSVAASQFAAAGVLIAAVVYKERLRWWQSLGVLLASVGVGLLAAG